MPRSVCAYLSGPDIYDIPDGDRCQEPGVVTVMFGNYARCYCIPHAQYAIRLPNARIRTSPPQPERPMAPMLEDRGT